MKYSFILFIYLYRIVLFAAGLWSVAAVPVLLKLPAIPALIFQIALGILFIAGFINRNYHVMLGICEAAFLIFFLTLTPEQQFKNTRFMRQFAVKPSIVFLQDGLFEVRNFRNNIYRSEEDYDQTTSVEQFDLDKIEKLELASVYWDWMSLVAHNMLNFHFSDGKQLTVSVEPRVPENGSREPFHCLCKQHELLIILGSPEDLLDLRTVHRGEDMYLYETAFTRDECRTILQHIIQKVHKLEKSPEFYHLFNRNCITALYPAMRQACPELKFDLRVLFNGYFDRMLFEKGLLKKRKDESFESLKSRSFVPGKSQGKL